MTHQINFYCPGSLSFIFKKVNKKDLLKSGSVGIGCTIDIGVKATAVISDVTRVEFNGKEINFPTVTDAIKYVTNQPIHVSLFSDLPLGYGFGLSGSSALASILAVNQLLNLRMSRKKLIEFAHIAEIENKTGLGTVGTETAGGFLVKTSAGIPFNYYTLPFIGKKIYVIIIDKLATPDILKNKQKLDKIESAANFALKKIKNLETTTLEEILDISYEFVLASLLLTETRVHDVIEKIRQRNGHATMAIFGNVVITTQRPIFDTPYDIRELIISDNHV